MFIKRLYKSKTFWMAIAALVYATEQVVTGQSTVDAQLAIVVPAILAIFVRDGIAKGK